MEPIRDSALLWWVRRRIPWQQANVSPFERPLFTAELHRFGAAFEWVLSRRFRLPWIGIFEHFLPRWEHAAIRLDARLLSVIPALERYASICVFEIRKPPGVGSRTDNGT